MCFVYSLLCLGCLSLLCLVFCVFSVSHEFCVFCVFYVFHVQCVLCVLVCSGWPALSWGAVCWGGGGDWGVVGEPIRGGEEGCSGGGRGIERYQNFLTKAAFEHLVANFGYDSFSDVGESRVWFASKNLTPCRMH